MLSVLRVVYLSMSDAELLSATGLGGIGRILCAWACRSLCALKMCDVMTVPSLDKIYAHALEALVMKCSDKGRGLSDSLCFF